MKNRFHAGLLLEPGAGILDPGAGNPPGNPPADWRLSIPEDIRTHASLKDIKDIPSLAKSYVHAQTLVGSEKVLKPRPDWKPEQWGAFYDSVGRPPTTDGYKFGEDVIPKEATVDPEKLKNVQKLFHDNGLTPNQASAVMKYYMDSITTAEKTTSEQRTSAQMAATNALKKEYGDSYDSKIEIAKSVVHKFGDQEFLQSLEETGLGNDPRLVRMFIKLGEAMLDDTARGSSSGLIVTNEISAQQEINSLKLDKEFTAALTDRNNPAHKTAVEKWTKLHEVGYPTKK